VTQALCYYDTPIQGSGQWHSSGGDVPGLNAVIKSVTYRGSENDIEVVGLRRGWEALTHLNLDDPASNLTTSSR
jgi:6-phosphofructokinase